MRNSVCVCNSSPTNMQKPPYMPSVSFCCQFPKVIPLKLTYLYSQLLGNMLYDDRRNILFTLGKFSVQLERFEEHCTAQLVIVGFTCRRNQLYFFGNQCPVVNKLGWCPLLLHN